jgi:hypothetical protein
MPTSPHEIVDLGDRIVAAFPNEVGWRSGISRAYYGALHVTADVFPNSVSQGSTHERVIGAASSYGTGPNPARRSAAEIAQLLRKLKRRRTRADYYLDEEVTVRDFSDHRVQVERVFELCTIVSGARAAIQQRNATERVTAPTAASADLVPRPPSGPRPALKRIK